MELFGPPPWHEILSASGDVRPCRGRVGRLSQPQDPHLRVGTRSGILQMHSSAYSEPSGLRDGGVLDCAKRLQDLERLQDLGGEMQKLEGIEGRRGGAQTMV